MSAMNVASNDQPEIVRREESFRTSREDADIDWRRTDTYNVSNAIAGYLYFINSDGSSARGTCNAVTYIYANTYVLIHSPRRFTNRLWLFITSSALTAPGIAFRFRNRWIGLPPARNFGRVTSRERKRSLPLTADNYYRRGKRLEINDYCILELVIWVGPH